MSTCVFCRQPIGVGGSLCLYHRADTGAEGYACAHCQEQLRQRGFGCPSPAASQAATPPSSQDHKHQAAVTPPAASQGHQPQAAATPPPSQGKRLQTASKSRGNPPPAPSPRQNPWDPARRRRLSYLLEDSPSLKRDTSLHSPWIVGMKIFAWLLFAATVAAVCLWGGRVASLLGYFPGTAIFVVALVLVALVVGLLVTSLVMVPLNMARDVRLLRIRLTEEEER